MTVDQAKAALALVTERMEEYKKASKKGRKAKRTTSEGERRPSDQEDKKSSEHGDEENPEPEDEGKPSDEQEHLLG